MAFTSCEHREPCQRIAAKAANPAQTQGHRSSSFASRCQASAPTCSESSQILTRISTLTKLGTAAFLSGSAVFGSRVHPRLPVIVRNDRRVLDERNETEIQRAPTGRGVRLPRSLQGSSTSSERCSAELCCPLGAAETHICCSRRLGCLEAFTEFFESPIKAPGLESHTRRLQWIA